MADNSTPLAEALRKLPLEKALGTLEIIEKLTQNTARNPDDDKYRHIKLTNAKIAAAITNVPHAVEALLKMGWIQTPDGLALPASVRLGEEKEVLAITEAKEYYKQRLAAPEVAPTPTVGEAAGGAASGAASGVAGDVFEYKDYDGERVRLVKLRDEPGEIIDIEVFVEGKSFWKGRPTFSDLTGQLTCGDKGASEVPEADRERLKAYLAAWKSPVLKLSLG